MTALIDALGALTIPHLVMIAVAGALFVWAALVALTATVLGLTRATLAWGLIVAAAFGALALAPVDPLTEGPGPDPALSYEAAVARFAAERAAISEPLNPLCEPQLRTHGQKTDRVVVLIHGVSSCPRAFETFAPVLFSGGANVLVPLLPQHGHADRATHAMATLTAASLRDAAADAVDIAAGLGDEIVILGISAGGTAAAWAAQNRAEVDRAILVAPFFGLAGFGIEANEFLMKAMLWLPDLTLYKDFGEREAWTDMPHAYVSQSSRAIGEIIRLGETVRQEAAQTPPAAGEIAAILNDADKAVSNALTDELLAAWAENGAAVTRFSFGEDRGLGHELIDPMEPNADTGLTHRLILQAIENPSALATSPFATAQ